MKPKLGCLGYGALFPFCHAALAALSRPSSRTPAARQRDHHFDALALTSLAGLHLERGSSDGLFLRNAAFWACRLGGIFRVAGVTV